MDAAQSVSLEVPSRLDQVKPVIDQLVEHMVAAGYPEKTRFAIRLAMDEAVTNAIRHGNALDESKMAHVDWRCTADSFHAVVRDHGTGFRPEDLPDPTDPANLTKPCGRGVMLMRVYMDHVSFNEAGNEVTLVKQVTCDS